MGLEATLISNVLKRHEFKPLVKAGLTEEDFETLEGKDWFRHISRIYFSRTTYGEVPSLESFKRKFRSFDFRPSKDSLTSLCQEIINRNMSNDASLLCEEMLDDLDADDLDDAMSKVAAFLTRWQTRKAEGGDIDLSQSVKMLREQYERVASAEGMLGIPWPWEPVNRETLGMQSGQLVLLYGRPKHMKTWVALYIAINAYLYHHARVLFYSREMNKMQLLLRGTSIICEVDYGTLKRGELPPSVKKDVFATMEDLAESDGDLKRADGRRSAFIISNDRGPNHGATVRMLVEKAKEVDADLLVVDAVYKLADGRTKNRDAKWTTQVNIMQDLKDAAVDLEIPVIAVTQANRKAAKSAKNVDTDEAAFTDSAGMECDFMLRVIKSKDADTGKSELTLCWPAARDEELYPMLIHGQPGNNFSVKQERLTDEDLEDRAKAADAQDEEENKKNKRSSRAGPGRRSGGGRGALAQARTGAKRKKSK